MTALAVAYGGAACQDSYYSTSPMIHWHRAGSNAEERQLFGVINDPPTSFTWAAPAQLASSVPGDRMAFDVGSRIISVGFGAVHALTPPTAAWETLQSPSSATYGAGGPALAAWFESDSAKLQGWAPDGRGVRTLLDAAPKTSCVLGIGEKFVVGVAADACLGGSATLRFWTLPTAGASNDLQLGPALRVPVFVSAPDAVRTSGDYAAIIVSGFNPATGETVDPPYFIVTKLSTFEAFRVDGRKGMLAHESMWTLDDTYLYWGEMASALDAPRVRRMVRFPLSQLAASGVPIAQ